MEEKKQPASGTVPATSERTAISHQPSAISHQPSAISHQPSAISHQPSAISHQPSAISIQPCKKQCQPTDSIYSPFFGISGGIFRLLYTRSVGARSARGQVNLRDFLLSGGSHSGLKPGRSSL